MAKHYIDNDMDTSENWDITALHGQATHNLALKTYKIREEIILLPSLHSMYFRPQDESTLIPTVPLDLQLDFFFHCYSEMARAGFVAQKKADMQNIDISRAIWFYGFDKGHSFSRFWDRVRHNIVLMAFVWAAGFDRRYCAEGCDEFVKAYLRVWMESLVCQHDHSDNTFNLREDFIALWHNSPFGLYFLSIRESKYMSKVMNNLMYELHSTEVLSPANFIQAVRNGQITEAVFEEHGAAMALQWVFGMEKEARKKQVGIDIDNDVNQADLAMQQAKRDTAAADAKIKAIQERKTSGLPLEEVYMAEEDEFDPFPEDVHPGMSKVQWDEGIVASLLVPVDAELPHPKDVLDEHRPVVERAGLWISHAQIKAIFNVDENKEEPSQGMVMLTAMLEDKLE